MPTIPATRRPRLKLALAALCGMLITTPAAAQWVAAELFPNPPAPTEAGPHGIESLAGVVDTTPVERGLGRLRLKLPGGGTVELARDGFERRKDGDVTWRGQIEGDKDSRAILTVKNGYMAGRIYYGLEEFEIRPGAGYSHVIERVDTGIVPIDEHVEPEIAYSDNTIPETFPDPSAPVYGNSPDDIQLMAIYTPQALAAAGGTPQIEVRIQSMIDLANTAFIDSGMIARYALIHTTEVAQDDTGWAFMDLLLISDNIDVMVQRNVVGADMVSLIIENNGRCAGAAYIMTSPGHEFGSYAYQVSALGCGGGVFAHEHGHNMGFDHNPEDSIEAQENYDIFGNLLTASYPWSFGHYVDGSFRTIMSYPTWCASGCPMALRFSNPNITFLGSPTGIVDQRDNARTGDLTAPIVADFMDAVTGSVVNRRVAASVEDVEELADGSIRLNSTTLELGDALSGVQAVGLRFQDLNIPPGMRIDSAYLEFEAADIGSTATVVEISAEAADNATAFTSGAFDVTGRSATLASVAWNLRAWDTVTEKHYSPDISAVIQEVVDRPGWLENNSMVLTVGGTGIRAARAYDGGATAAPLLHVKYSSPSSPAIVSLPTAAFSYSCTGLTCTFTDQSTDSDGVIVAWSWDFFYDPTGAPGSSAEQNPTVTFPAEGTYNILQSVTDDQGWQSRMNWDVFLTITETSVNIPPTATDNYYSTDKNTPISGNLLTDGTPDSDIDGDPLTATTEFPSPEFSVAANGDFTYTPPSFFDPGTYLYEYRVSDGNGGSAQANVFFTILPVSDGPVATDNGYKTIMDVAISGNVLTDGEPDSDPDGDPLTVVANSAPINFGTVTMAANGDFTYTPAAGFIVTDSFTYTVSDGSNSATATVTVKVDPPDEVPTATDNAYTTDEDVAISGNVLTDGVPDSDPNGDVLTVTANTNPLNGTVTVAANGVFTYTPNADFNGSDSFTYTVSDGNGNDASGTVAITVNPVGDSPVATDNAYATDEDIAVSGNVLTDGTPDSDADGDTLTVTANTSPLNGTVTVAATGAFTYTPAAEFSGADSFTYTISDGNGGSATATVAITVNPVNDPPVAVFGDSCTKLVCVFTDSSTDIDGAIASWSWSFGDGAVSTVQNPTHDYATFGVYTVTLTVTDSGGATATASGVVAIGASNPPLATDNAYTTDEDVAVSGNVLTDGTPDSDPDGDPLTVTANSSPLNGTVTVAATGVFTYTPGTDFNGTDSFTYTASDDNGGNTTATVTITVAPVNDVPVATNDNYTTDEDVAISGNVLTDGVPDNDIDGDTLTVTANTNSSFGAVTIAANGAFTFTPNANVNGIFAFTYTVSDGNGGSARATVTIVVNAVNDPPVAAFRYSCTEEIYCSFTNTSTDVDGNIPTDQDGNIASGAWSFSGGNYYNVVKYPFFASATFEYGIYTITLMVTDDAGATGTVSQTLYVGNKDPIAVDNTYIASEDIAKSGNVLTDGTKDSDPDGDPLTVTATTDPLNGSVTMAANGIFTYTPNENFYGTDSFVYTVSDGKDGIDTATVTMTVNGVNDTPVATDNTYTTDEDVAVSGNVLTDGTPDSDVDGDRVSVTGYTSATFGTVQVSNLDGSFTYTPNANFNGTDSFTYTVGDGIGGTATGTVTITVSSVNDTPVATANAYATVESIAVTGNVLTDGVPDSDADGDPLTVTANSSPLNGTVTMAANGAFTYTANAGFGGSDSFTYTVSDGNGGTATATVTIDVNMPVATNNSYATNEDVVVSGNVLTDGTPDSDPNGDPLTVTANTAPLSGILTMAANGAFTYTPNANFFGTDSFDYTVSNPLGVTATATVTITVISVNDAPVATDNAYTTDEEVMLSGNVMTDGIADSDIEGDSLYMAGYSAPRYGVVNWAGNGSFTYLPGRNFNGSDSFIYTISDHNGGTATATVTITVNPVNDAPSAIFAYGCTGLDCVFYDHSSDSQDAGGSIVSWSWSFGDGAISEVQSPTHSYAAYGIYRVSLTVTDNDGATTTLAVDVTVANSAPVATDDAYTTNEDVAVSGNVLLDGTADSDIDGDALTVTANTAPLNGTVTMAATGAFTYAPNADFNGSDSFTYTVSDGNLGTSTATVTITVNPANDAPVATDNGYTTDEDVAVSGNVLTDGVPDSDVDGDALTVTANTSPLNGTVTVAANGAFIYTPSADFNGSDSFGYTVSDGNLGTATATVTITVSPVNDAPVAAFSITCTDLDCRFIGGSTDIDGTVVAWSWDFGDGAMSIDEGRTQHSYAAVDGTYTVTLTVTDDQGASDTVAQSVTLVNPFPPAAPSGLVGTSTTSGKGSNAVMAVTLNWTDNAINEEAFVIERCEVQRSGGAMMCSFAPIAEVGADVTGYADSVPGNASFRYRVKARNRNGESGYSNETEVPSTQTAAVNK